CLIPSHRLNNAGWEGIAEDIVGCYSAISGCIPRLSKCVDEQVVWRVVPPDIDGQVEHSISGSDDSIVVQLIRKADTWADAPPRIKGTATWSQRGMYQAEFTLQVWHSESASDWTGCVW